MAFESLYRSTLAQRLEASATEILVATAPTATNGRMRIIRGNTTEFISYTWVTQNTNNATLTWVTRGLSRTADPATWGTGQTFAAGSQIVLVAMHDQLADKSSDTSFEWTQTFENVIVDNQITIPRYASEAARDAAIPTPINWMSGIYRSDLGLYQDYTAGSWQNRAVAWADRLVAATGTDTVPWTLDQKASAWDGIATEVLNPWANEQIDIKVDILETNWLQITWGQLDVNKSANNQIWTIRIATDDEANDNTNSTECITPSQLYMDWITASDTIRVESLSQAEIVVFSTSSNTPFDTAKNFQIQWFPQWWTLRVTWDVFVVWNSDIDFGYNINSTSWGNVDIVSNIPANTLTSFTEDITISNNDSIRLGFQSTWPNGVTCRLSNVRLRYDYTSSGRWTPFNVE